MIDWENLTDEQHLSIDWHNLPLEDRINRLNLCAKKLKELHDELSSLGMVNIPFDINNPWPSVPIDYYDKDFDTNLDILCGLCNLETVALARVEELSNHVEDAV